LGGDEFLVLLGDIEPRSASGPHLVVPSRARTVVSDLANRIGAALAEPIHLDGHPVTTSAAIGISIYPEDARDARGLMKRADLAMYSVKRAGDGAGHAIAGDLPEDESASAS
jgi:GGDEF domain-containing protein